MAKRIAKRHTLRIDYLKFLLQEKNFEYFDDADLMILYTSYSNIFQCAMEGCLLKAQDDSVSLGILNTPTNQKYWLKLASHYETKWKAGYDYSEDGKLITPPKSSSSSITMRRADEC